MTNDEWLATLARLCERQQAQCPSTTLLEE